MQTLLSRFCEEFVGIVRPLLDPLGRAADAVATANGGQPRRAIHDELLDLRHQIDLLASKVAEQQAYVLIFGPLKSGKSTLMNAISASYVSEVTSLPAYPCMVYVSHAPERAFTATCYDGTIRSFDDLDELQRHVDEAHTELATRIRESEAAGSSFDPIDNFRTAIRRIDVRLPIDVLAPSKAVLVDTPGLYTRMKFGYDRMTRDFQNAAACAVFVVRSDNLFLDQVFAEFNKLLELFSRIFLVVNVDSNKQDLGADGKLVPSLEQRDPGKIIQAFENLTMSAPLRKAADEGKLRIYPVDLLHAASERLRSTRKRDGAPESEFDRFFADLTEYLDSTDYLVAFLGDSLRRATTLANEIGALCRSTEISSLEQTLETLESETESAGKKLSSAQRLSASDWGKGLDWLRQDTKRVLQELAGEVSDGTSRAMSEKVARWFKTNESLDDLVRRGLTPALKDHQDKIASALHKELAERLAGGQAGIRVSAEIRDLLTEVGADLGAVGRNAHAQIDQSALAPPSKPLGSEHVNVRRTFWDRILFRGRAAVARRLFGADEKQKLTPEVKAQRLGESARADIARRLSTYQSNYFAQTLDQTHARFLDRYADHVQRGLREAFTKTRERIETQLVRLEAECARLRGILGPIGDLGRKSEESQKAIEGLSSHYGQMDLYLLTKPVEPDYELPALAPEERVTESETPPAQERISVEPESPPPDRP